jgi:hypothetical protein
MAAVTADKKAEKALRNGNGHAPSRIETVPTAAQAVNAEVIDEKIIELVDLVRANQQRIAALEARINVAKDQLRDLVNQRGSNWKDDEGYVRLVGESVRKSYDTQSLDELIITDPLRYGWLKDYRKEVTIRGGIQVR